MNEVNILPTSSISFEIFVNISSSKYPISFAITNCVFSSYSEPFAIDKNWRNSLFPPLPNPSAIFEGIETAALLIWSLNPKSFAKLPWLEAL